MDEIIEIINGILKEESQKIINDAPAHLFKNNPEAINFAISSTCCSLRGFVLEQALKQGYICYSDKPNEGKNRALGAYLVI